MTRQPTPSILDAVLTADVATPDRTALRGRLRWDYTQVAPVDRRTVEDAAVDILANGQRATAGMMSIGSRLIEIKRLLPHGQFSDWCTTEFDMSQRSAQVWMNAARAFEGKSAEISLLSDSSLAMLAAPSTPEPARLEAIAEAQATGRSPSVARTKEIIAQHKPGPAVQPAAKEYSAAVQATQPERTMISYAKLCILIEDEIAPTCDLYTVDRRWLAEHIEDRLHQRDMTADATLIAQAISETAEELRQKDQRERRLSAARAAAEEADRQRIIDVQAATIDVLPPIERRLEPHLAARTFTVPDGRVSAARALIRLYAEVIATEDQYGALTGHFSDWLAPKRELTAMIGHLEHLIAIIEHPEEATPDN